MLARNKWVLVGIVIGAIAGWCYWYYVGCASGTCPITSSPYISTLYGAIMGALGFSSFRNQKQINKTEENE